MAKRTYIPAIKAACKFLQRLVGTNKAKIEENAGAGLYALIVALLEAVDAVVAFIEGHSDAAGNFVKPA